MHQQQLAEQALRNQLPGPKEHGPQGAIVAIDPSAFGDLAEFKSTVDMLVADLRASQRLPGVDRIRVPGERSGRYRMDGLLLRIDYDDGRQEHRVLITDPAKPGGVLWLDGESYVERR